MESVPRASDRRHLIVSHPGSSGAHTSAGPASTEDACDIFVSLRIAEAKRHARALKEAIESRRPEIKCFVSGDNHYGAPIAQIIPAALKRSRMAIVMGMETYGKDTGSNFGTLQEMQYILKNFKHDDGRALFPIKMCYEFDPSVPHTVVSDRSSNHLPRSQSGPGGSFWWMVHAALEATRCLLLCCCVAAAHS